ncbi:MAG: hypothetical protein JWM64_679 [Frankiales bacterium]|nr:hypothetical protein [Frankiales bacterium]
MTSGTPYPEGPYGNSGSTQVGATGSTFDPSSASVGQLVGQVTNDLSTLMRQEFALAKAELTEEAKKAGKGAGALGAAGYLGYLASIFASLTLMFVLDTFMPIWAAALIVTALYGLIAFVLFSKGKKQMKTVDPTPRQTVETLKEDVAWARHQTN